MGLDKVFKFYIEQLVKLFDLMKQIPVLDSLSLYDTTIILIVIYIFTKLIRFGVEKVSIYDDATNTYKTTISRTVNYGTKLKRRKSSRPKEIIIDRSEN